MTVLGTVLLIGALTGIILNFTAPWVKITEAGDPDTPTLDRSEYKDTVEGPNEVAYSMAVLSWPVLAFVFLMIMGVALIALDLVPNLVGLQRVFQATALLVASFFSLLLALSGLRMFGEYLMRIWGTGDVPYHLHVAPYVNLALGLVFLGACIYYLRERLGYFTAGPSRGQLSPWATRIPAWTALVVVAGLLVMPLLPFVVVKEEGSETSAYAGEQNLAEAKESSVDSAAKPGKDLATARAMMWITLFVSIPTLGFALVERYGRLPLLWGVLTQIFVLTAVPLIIGIVYTILLYVDVPKIGGDSNVGFVDYTLGFNYFPPLIFVGLAILLFRFVTAVTVPFFARVSAEQRATPA